MTPNVQLLVQTVIFFLTVLQISLTVADSHSCACTKQHPQLTGPAILGMFRVAVAEHSKLAWASGSICHLTKGVKQPHWDPKFKGFGQHVSASTFLVNKLCRAEANR